MIAARLAELAGDAAAEAPGSAATSEGGASEGHTSEGGVTTWAVAGRPFAVLAGGSIDFRLDPAVGAAARRTPDTATSQRGEDWVTFAPAELDQYAEDRVRAWFAASYRRATS